MSLPLTTPLILPSEYNENAVSGQVTNIPVLLKGIVRASEYLQGTSGRRFDEWRETRRYTSFLERDGGDLLDQFTLMLDNDLREVVQLAQRVPIGGDIDDGIQILPSAYRLLSHNQIQGRNTVLYSQIHINMYSGAFFYAGGVDPYESIWLDGLWGFGGQWLNTGVVLAGSLNTSATTVAVLHNTTLEVGMMSRIGSEYVYIDAIASSTPNDTLTLVRAVNGSTAESHDANAPIYYWQASDVARDLVSRLVQWRVEQRKAPMAGQVTIGDFSFPVDTSGLPKDLYISIRDAGLIRMGNVVGI